MQKPVTDNSARARAQFFKGVAMATSYKPQIEMRLNSYRLDNQWRVFMFKTVKGANAAYSPNDPKLFKRSAELIAAQKTG